MYKTRNLYRLLAFLVYQHSILLFILGYIRSTRDFIQWENEGNWSGKTSLGPFVCTAMLRTKYQIRTIHGCLLQTLDPSSHDNARTHGCNQVCKAWINDQSLDYPPRKCAKCGLKPTLSNWTREGEWSHINWKLCQPWSIGKLLCADSHKQKVLVCVINSFTQRRKWGGARTIVNFVGRAAPVSNLSQDCVASYVMPRCRLWKNA